MWEFTYNESIEAPAEAVFRLIEDLSGYEKWNPFLVRASGNIAVGGTVTGRSNLGWTVTPFKHKIFDYSLNQRLCWRDFGFAAVFACGERSRFVTEADGTTKYRCHLKLTGPFAGLINVLFGKGLRQGVEAEARAMKVMAEGGGNGG